MMPASCGSDPILKKPNQLVQERLTLISMMDQVGRTKQIDPIHKVNGRDTSCDSHKQLR